MLGGVYGVVMLVLVYMLIDIVVGCGDFNLVLMVVSMLIILSMVVLMIIFCWLLKLVLIDDEVISEID